MSHNEAVRDQFRLQASTFTDTSFAARGLDWILAELAPEATERVLDVAAGAAHLGRALAPHVAHVTALALTPEMLVQGRRLAESAGLRNIGFLVGDAVALPWLPGTFDLTVCRLALHRVADPAAVVREMVRVTRPGGRVAVVDLTAVDAPLLAGEADRIERLRDPSHGTTLSSSAIASLLALAGARVVSTVSRDQPLDALDWLARTGSSSVVRSRVRRRFEEELAGGVPTGLRPYRSGDGVLMLTHQWTILVATAGG